MGCAFASHYAAELYTIIESQTDERLSVQVRRHAVHGSKWRPRTEIVSHGKTPGREAAVLS